MKDKWRVVHHQTGSMGRWLELEFEHGIPAKSIGVALSGETPSRLSIGEIVIQAVDFQGLI